MEKIQKLMQERRSVRTYDGKELSETDRKKLEDGIKNIDNPYHIPVEFRLLDAKQHGLTSPVISGANLYVGAKVKRVPHAEEAYGYSFERFVLLAQSLGIGTVWIGGTMNRPAFEAAMETAPDEMMPCATPIGYAAAKMSLRETMMRKGVHADSRDDFGDLFFDAAFGVALTREKAGKLCMPLKMVQWAPSAVNKQPWRVIVSGNAVHFYEKKTKGYVGDATGDLQKIDVGIALCHFELTAKEEGIDAEFSVSDPGIQTDSDTEYIASFLITNL